MKRSDSSDNVILSYDYAHLGSCRNLNNTATATVISATAFSSGIPPTTVLSTNAAYSGGKAYAHVHIYAATGTATWILYGYSPLSSQWHVIYKTSSIAPMTRGASSPINGFLVNLYNGYQYIGLACTTLGATGGGGVQHRAYIGG